MGDLAGQAVQHGVHWEGGVQQTAKDKTQTQHLDGLELLKGLWDETDLIVDWIPGKL